MSKNRFFVVTSVSCLTASLLLCAPTWAKESKSNLLALIGLGEYGIEWYPNVDYTAAVLTVSGPNDLIVSQTFENGGQVPFFDFRDADGAVRANGGYNFEITFYPVLDEATQKALKGMGGADREQLMNQLKTEGKFPEGSFTQSGYFTLEDGSALFESAEESKTLFTGDSDEPTTTKDQVILDDLIVDGSICAGFDCVNGESFGFDTLRLKENNLRIRAQDTSNSASFPTNDWQITFNDTTNGGANKFSIDDIDGGRTPFTLEASAPSHSLYVDDGGRLGFGTSTPVADLHVKSGNTPTLRLDQDGSSGFTAQTWDVAGNEANFFLRDVSNGSTLPFRIRPGAPTSVIDIAGDGNIGIGTASPVAGAEIHVENTGGDDVDDVVITENGQIGVGTTAPFARLDVAALEASPNGISSGLSVTDSLGTQVAYLLVPANGNGELRLRDNGTNKVSIKSSGTTWFDGGDVGIGNNAPTHLLDVGTSGAYCDGGNWVDGSSRDFKKDIEPLTEENVEELFETLDRVELVKFLYKHESDERTPRVGMIAEDMPDVLASEDRKGLELGRHVGFLMAIVKEINSEKEQMAEQIAEMRAEIEALKAHK